MCHATPNLVDTAKFFHLWTPLVLAYEQSGFLLQCIFSGHCSWQKTLGLGTIWVTMGYHSRTGMRFTRCLRGAYARLVKSRVLVALSSPNTSQDQVPVNTTNLLNQSGLHIIWPLQSNKHKRICGTKNYATLRTAVFSFLHPTLFLPELHALPARGFMASLMKTCGPHKNEQTNPEQQQTHNTQIDPNLLLFTFQAT